MTINFLKGMRVKKEKSKSNEGEIAETPFVTVKKEYPTDSNPQQGTKTLEFPIILKKLDFS